MGSILDRGPIGDVGGNRILTALSDQGSTSPNKGPLRTILDIDRLDAPPATMAHHRTKGDAGRPKAVLVPMATLGLTDVRLEGVSA